jgi:hypothetical protein
MKAGGSTNMYGAVPLPDEGVRSGPERRVYGSVNGWTGRTNQLPFSRVPADLKPQTNALRSARQDKLAVAAGQSDQFVSVVPQHSNHLAIGKGLARGAGRCHSASVHRRLEAQLPKA